MDLSNLIASLTPITKDLVSYIPLIQLQNGYWLAVRQGDVALTNAVALYLIQIP